MESFFFYYLQQRFGLPNVMAEYAYSLMDSLERFSYDPDCDLFLKVLEGALLIAVIEMK